MAVSEGVGGIGVDVGVKVATVVAVFDGDTVIVGVELGLGVTVGGTGAGIVGDGF